MRPRENRSSDQPLEPLAKVMGTSADTTRLLAEAGGGNPQAADALLALVYDELRELAEACMRRERPGHTLQPTALVHEAFLRLVDQTRVDWQGRTHFKAVAARAMQRLLVDHARGRDREKRGAGWRRVALDDAFLAGPDRAFDSLMLQEALDKMRLLDPRQTQVVEYRLLGGLDARETARILGVSLRTVERDWTMGRAWLRRELSKGDRPDG
jgi:RNA polymerase sigma factor (TIGR02999 family)